MLSLGLCFPSFCCFGAPQYAMRSPAVRSPGRLPTVSFSGSAGTRQLRPAPLLLPAALGLDVASVAYRGGPPASRLRCSGPSHSASGATVESASGEGYATWKVGQKIGRMRVCMPSQGADSLSTVLETEIAVHHHLTGCGHRVARPPLPACPLTGRFPRGLFIYRYVLAQAKRLT